MSFHTDHGLKHSTSKARPSISLHHAHGKELEAAGLWPPMLEGEQTSKKRLKIERLKVRPQHFHMVNTLKVPAGFKLLICIIGLTVAE